MRINNKVQRGSGSSLRVRLSSVELTSLTLDKQMQHKKSTTVDDHNMATGNLATWQGQHNSKTLAACDDKIVRGSSSKSRKQEDRGKRKAEAEANWDCSRKWQHVLYTQLIQSQRVRLSKKIDDV